MQQAYRSKNLGLSETHENQLLKLKQELTARASSRFFDKANVKKTRYRFQTHRLTKAPNLQRGTHD